MEQSRQNIMQNPVQARRPDIVNAETATRSYSSWRKRVLAIQIDSAFVVPFILLGLILSFKGVQHGSNFWYLFAAIISTTYGMLVGFYNRCIMMGLTGQSWGKRFVGSRLVSEATGQPIGVGNAIVREMAHIVDIIPLGLGYLLPIVDRKRQTGADKITGAVVVETSQNIASYKLDDIV
jgi:uncharacterized RDD family membrane protein YckC